MQMTLRWYGSKYDTVTLKQIRQIPGVTGVISTLYGTAPGEVWEMDDILALKTEIEAAYSWPVSRVSTFTMPSRSVLPTVNNI